MTSKQNESESTSTTLTRSTSLTPSEAEPKLCLNGCGFFGSPSNKNLCSKCYKSICAEKSQKSQTAAAKTAVKNSFKTLIVAEQPEIPKLDASGPKPPLNRCNCCNKKVGLLGFKCKCGSTFCGVHRYPESHGCNHDYKEIGREVIAKENPLLKADKLQRL